LVPMRTQQALDPSAEFGLVRTSLVQERELLGQRRLLQGTVKERFFDHGNSRLASTFLNEKRKGKAPPKMRKGSRAAHRVAQPGAGKGPVAIRRRRRNPQH